MNPSIQRAYLYLVALVALHMLVLGAANVLRVAVELVTRPLVILISSPADGARDRVLAALAPAEHAEILDIDAEVVQERLRGLRRGQDGAEVSRERKRAPFRFGTSLRTYV